MGAAPRIYPIRQRLFLSPDCKPHHFLLYDTQRELCKNMQWNDLSVLMLRPNFMFMSLDLQEYQLCWITLIFCFHLHMISPLCILLPDVPMGIWCTGTFLMPDHCQIGRNILLLISADIYCLSGDNWLIFHLMKEHVVFSIFFFGVYGLKAWNRYFGACCWSRKLQNWWMGDYFDVELPHHSGDPYTASNLQYQNQCLKRTDP